MTALIEKTEKLIRDMRWRALHYLQPKKAGRDKETYGFNSKKSAPVVEELKVFESRMAELIQNIEFDERTNDFQKELARDLKNVNSDDHLVVKADKTSNFYRMKPEEYKQLLDKNIQKTYKKAEKKHEEQINKEAKAIAEELGLADRVEAMARRDAFITLKDHKANFQNAPTCRLINPTKSEIGKMAKQILQKIVKNTAVATKVNLWRNTNSVLEWFNAIENKNSAYFVCFDIVDFYPSITEKLLSDAIEFATRHANIAPTDIEIIMHSKKTLLFSGDIPWVKKDTHSGSFDVTMGSYDGAETCELVVVYMLAQLKNFCGNTIGLYRDDGLAVLHETPRTIERIKQQICQLFARNGLRITIEANKKVVNYLDVTLDLNSGKHHPFFESRQRTHLCTRQK